MVSEYLVIEVVLVLASLLYLSRYKYLQSPRLWRILLLSFIGFLLLLLEIPFYKSGTWLFPSQNVIGISVLGFPLEEFIFYVVVFPLVATSLWVLAGMLERWRR